MAEKIKTSASIFPRWANTVPILIGLGAAGAPFYVILIVWFGFSPKTTDVGYQPKQPIAYSHALHAGQLGIDCRYCHTTVEKAGFAAIPPTATCMNCHQTIKAGRRAGSADEIAKLVGYWERKEPIPWVKVHDLPDYVQFNHSAHVNKGVSCVECHGRVDKMVKVWQDKPLSMGWCLECHRDPGPRLRPKDEVFNLAWSLESMSEAQKKEWGLTGTGDEARAALAQVLLHHFDIKSLRQMTDCSTCHR